MKRPVVLTRQQARRIDRLAMEQYGVPGLILMENAGRQCAEAAVEMLGDPAGRKVTVLCGPGNNGGDGFVVARYLANRDANIRVALLADAEKILTRGDDPAVNLSILLKTGMPVHEVALKKEVVAALDSDLIVDALLGTGVHGPMRPPFSSAIRAVNECAADVLAVDVPSGLDCDTGRPLGVAVRARRTVTFVGIKVGFLQPGADAYTGTLQVVDIGVPRIVFEHLEPGRQEEDG